MTTTFPSSPAEPGGLSVKICGLTEPVSLDAALAAGAAYVGFVFFPRSPRALTPEETRPLAERASAATRVALAVDPDDALLDAIAALPIDLLQLHGHESPERVVEARLRTGLPVMKAIGVAEEEDLAQIDRYAGAADRLLIDAKPPRESVLPGGNGLSFDWRLLQGRSWPLPWMLAGGLTAETVAEAGRLTGAREVDVSTGVERDRGVKDPDMIRAFIEAAGWAPAPA